MELSVEALAVSLSGRLVLDDITATLRPGRITAILGPNGAGKSSLVKAAAALIPLARGAVRLDGRDVAVFDPRERARWIGYLPQDAVVHWNVTAADVVALGRLPHRTPYAAPSPQDFDAIMRAMAATETLHFAERPIQQLSGGERARVLLARVLAGEPRWLLADEPLASLDPAHQIDILDRLRDAANAGAGVAIVLHDLGLAARAADDVLLLKDGLMAGFGPVAEALTPDAIRMVFGVEARWVDTPDGLPLLVTVGR
ncbi:ABC transporter ATP-binding protein [Sphingomonas alpina]|uniref:ABC transporter ATP-binding protein n=1 Tax=Sphingomonas alpina TaxID=653931 RepID=A0A7H0LDW1_9SPHN|nr:ABC transporter ATP-binding protein [Sphingomonas alpina]QNQ07864.1 ABC transporter ATP-binding protein [Sphingomonas alpina]